MANGYFNHVTNVISAGVRALAAQVNNIATEISQGFDALPTEAELKQNRTIYGGADTGAADAYVVALTYTPTLTDGLNFFFKAANANTGASTLNLNALGAKSILLASGAALVGGDILADQQIWLAYESNSDSFRIMSQSSSAGGGGGNATTIALLDESSDTTNFVPYAPDATGNQPLRTGTNLTFNSATGDLGATVFTGALVGNADTATNASTVTTNANLTGDVTSVGNATTVVTNANLTGGVTSVGNAATVITNANLTGDVTSVGNATTLTVAAISGQTDIGAAIVDADEFILDDGPSVIRRSAFSRVYTYIAAKMVAATHTWADTQTFSEIIASAKGVSFPATAVLSADANTLDDYQEGETSVLTFSSTAGGAGSITATSGQDTLHYTKIGRLVHIFGHIRFSAFGTVNAGGLNIFNMPFGLENLPGIGGDSIYFPVCTINTNATTNYHFMGRMDTTDNRITVYRGDGVSALTATDFMQVDSQIHFNFFYYSDD